MSTFCHNYAHSADEIERIRTRATSERGYVPDSWIAADAGHDGFGGRLTLCSWRWQAVPLPDLVRGSEKWTDDEEYAQVEDSTYDGRDLVRGSAL